MLKSRILIALLALAAVAPAPAHAGGKAKASPAASSSANRNIVQIAREAGTFTTLVKALEAAGLVGTLSGQGQGEFTVFAPTDAAFAKLPAGTVESLLKDKTALKNILLYHVVAGTAPAAQVVASTSLKTLNGQDLTVSTAGGPKVNGAAITATDLFARNGVVHVIDTVLLPN